MNFVSRESQCFPFKCTKITNTKLITFQFKFLHRILATNSFLKKIGITQSDLCTFCKTEVESLIHLFWSCRVPSIFWQEFKQWITTNYECRRRSKGGEMGEFSLPFSEPLSFFFILIPQILK